MMTDAHSRFSAAEVAARLEKIACCAAEMAAGDDLLMAGRRQAPWLAASVLIALVDRGAQTGVLLTQRAHSLNSHSGQIAFPGGRAESADKTPVDTALREAHEEIALDPAAVTLAGVLPPYYSATGYVITPVVGIIPAGVSLKENPAEVQVIFEVPLSFLMDPAHYQRCWRKVDGREHYFYVINWRQHVIWGMTAGILRQFYERVYG